MDTNKQLDIKAVIQGREYRTLNTMTIRQQAGVVSLSMLDVLIENDDEFPTVFGSCQIFFENKPFYFGFINSVESPEFNSGKEVKNYRLTVRSAEMLFNYKIINETYTDVYTQDIVKDLFEKHIKADGFTLGEVSKGRHFEDYNFAYTTLYNILTELGDDIGASFFITGDKVFNFITTNDFHEIPAPTHIKNLKKVESIDDLRTVQIITGASQDTAVQTAVERWGETQTAFVVGFQIIEAHGATINGAPVGVGLVGIDDTNPEITFLFSVFGNVVALNNNALIKPQAGDDVHFVYTGFFDIIVEEVNQTAKARIAEVSGTTGEIFNIHNDNTLKNFPDAEAFARNLLTEFSDPLQTVTCTCHNFDETEFNKMWVFSRDDLNITGKFAVVEKTLTQAFDKWNIRIKLTNR